MQIKELKSEGLSYTYAVTVPKEDLSAKLDAKIKEMQPQVSLKGFRPGKVPVSHIKKMFGQSIMKDVVEETVNESSQKAINDNKLRPAGQPKIDLRANGEDVTTGKADLEYEMTVESIPEFEPVDIETLKFTRLKYEATDADIDERLTELGQGQKTYKKKAKTAKAKKDDAVLIDFVGTIDGTEFEGGAMEGHQLVIGSGTFIPGFEDQLIGAKAGDELDVKVTFPENYQAADLAGKEAVFATKVHEVQGAKDAEIDDDFAKNFGLDDLAALKEAIKGQYEGELEMQSRMKLKRAILDELDKKHSFDLPAGMVAAEFDNIWAQVQAEKEAGQLDEDDAKKTDKQLEKDYRKIAERRVRLGLVLAEMGQKSEIQISNEELQQAMIAEARRYPGQEQQVIEFYQKNPQAIAQLRAPIYEEKVVDLIIEKSTVKDKKVDKEELFKEDDMI
ncbi:trigger factor [Litorimonas taeanensis]|uniref:Trigger factor n=1 Tax=Litorimonas taeanensis TaxID=568099 RepID=A0A420WJD4_9PROT|nr:trigger factor [Litorimonas taeanensis]RKQ71117.1 trigger factor [Litorimonas taeanensis]